MGGNKIRQKARLSLVILFKKGSDLVVKGYTITLPFRECNCVAPWGIEPQFSP